ncbi:MAG: SRPBCC family protein [Acidimicrobiales bacterium]
MTRHLEVSRDIAASPQAVFDAISDVTRMGEWSPECYACEWIDGATGPAVGAKFDGHNRNGDNEWTTQGEIVECVPGERFVFHALARGFHFATWGYQIEPTENGCRVTETWDDLRPDEIIARGPAISGVEDRTAFNAQSMATTLERVAAAVE